MDMVIAPKIVLGGLLIIGTLGYLKYQARMILESQQEVRDSEFVLFAWISDDPKVQAYVTAAFKRAGLKERAESVAT